MARVVLTGAPIMRALALASICLASLSATACTRTHQVKTTAPLPATRVSHGRGALEGVAVGAVVGVVIGGVGGYVQGDDPPEDLTVDCVLVADCSYTAGEKAAFGAMFGAALGATAGLAIGYAVGSKDVYVRAPGWRPEVTAAAAPGRVGATATWRF